MLKHSQALIAVVTRIDVEHDQAIAGDAEIGVGHDVTEPVLDHAGVERRAVHAIFG